MGARLSNFSTSLIACPRNTKPSAGGWDGDGGESPQPASAGRFIPRPSMPGDPFLTHAFRRVCRASSISLADVVKTAPSLISRLDPAARGSKGWPGTANTSRFCSPASLCRDEGPDRSAASTTTTPREEPEMIRFRRGKSWERAMKPG